MIHGGDLISYRSFYDGELVDFSSNINPLGYPQGLEEELIGGFGELESYPDILYRKLKSSLAAYLGCDSSQVVVGNGSVELIDGFIFLAKRVVLFTPSFAEYELRARAYRKETVYLAYKRDFQLDPKALERTLKKEDLLILGNPNNPTGLRLDRDTLQECYKLTREKGALLLLDEAFFEFCPEDYDSLELFKDGGYEGLIVLRAATKFFSLPGIRLGYGGTSERLARDVEEILLPWNINSLAERAGNFIFKDKTYIEKSRNYMEKERTFLMGELKRIGSLEVFPSQVNFILIRLKKFSQDRAFDFFLERGLVIRRCSNFRGLDKNYVRVAIKDRKNNLRLLEAFRSLDSLAEEESS